MKILLQIFVIFTRAGMEGRVCPIITKVLRAAARKTVTETTVNPVTQVK